MRTAVCARVRCRVQIADGVGSGVRFLAASLCSSSVRGTDVQLHVHSSCWPVWAQRFVLSHPAAIVFLSIARGCTATHAAARAKQQRNAVQRRHGSCAVCHCMGCMPVVGAGEDAVGGCRSNAAPMCPLSVAQQPSLGQPRNRRLQLRHPGFQGGSIPLCLQQQSGGSRCPSAAFREGARPSTCQPCVHPTCSTSCCWPSATSPRSWYTPNTPATATPARKAETRARNRADIAAAGTGRRAAAGDEQELLGGAD